MSSWRNLKKGKLWNKTVLILSAAFFLVFLAVFFSVPRPLFKVPYSTVIDSEEGKLLGARIAADQQWRFPEPDSLPVRYQTCVIHFEDRYFRSHPGINVFALARALVQNLRAGRVVSGGSTITMQVCRLARENPDRTILNKIIEMIWALNLELRFSKDEILKMYASHAPFGGNVVGIEAASWRYFSRPAAELSWAETATLAVLPNAPSLIYPGRFDQKLKEKRDRLLFKLLDDGEIDSMTYQLSLAEPIPEKAFALPELAYHLVERAVQEEGQKRTRTTIDYFLQQKLNEVAQSHHRVLEANHINNLAILVADLSTKEVKGYVGNVFDKNAAEHGSHVDIIQAPRSTGSILKPFLYCKMLDEGLITPRMLIPDVPTRFGGFTPTNFNHDYNGAVPAEEALARSLNIPAVKMLQSYGVAPFYNFLKKSGMKSLTKGPDHYGLSLILGGAEVSLWNLTGMYTSLAGLLQTYNTHDGSYPVNPFSELKWKKEIPVEIETQTTRGTVSAAAVYLTLDAMKQVERPESEEGWEEFTSARNIAWKTGTSYGFRDAWAVGISGRYVVAVWAGNADGEGRQGLTGIGAAAPVLFDVLSLFPASAWFTAPVDEMEQTEVCAQSGFRPGPDCEETTVLWLPRKSKVEVCPWHRKIHLDETAKYRVNADCYPVSKMKHQSWFVLPPAMEYYYKRSNPTYKTLPPVMAGCDQIQESMEFIYPREWEKVFIPRYLDGTSGQVVFELVHRSADAVVYWQLDQQFLGSTSGIHQQALHPAAGWHILNVTDNQGSSITKRFLVVETMENAN